MVLIRRWLVLLAVVSSLTISLLVKIQLKIDFKHHQRAADPLDTVPTESIESEKISPTKP
jgi:hypothetical protein